MGTLNNFHTFKSSAGSGKTYTLVKEFLKIVLKNEETTRYRNILAITFTNKAANEMKERVIENLKLLSEEEKSEDAIKLIEDYSKDFQIEKSIIQKRAKNVLVSILHNYSDLKISTIDKFTHKIIRAFSKDLDIAPDFEIELDVTNIMATAIDLLISKAGEDKNISSILIDFMDKQIEEDKSWNLEKNLIEFTKELTKEENQKYFDQIKEINFEEFKKINKEVQSKTNNYKKIIIETAKKVKHLLDSNSITEKDTDRGTIYNYFKKITEENLTEIFKSTRAITKLKDENIWLKKSASKTAKSSIEFIKNEAHSLFLEIQKTGSFYITFSLINENILNLVLVNEINKVITALKDENNILLISDFNQLISNEIKDQPAPFIYEKIGERYKNIMIDEFQDTSVLQWHNLLPLIDNSLSIGEKTLLVGDGKQAIYRFRGGKVEQFVSLPNIIDKQKNDYLLEQREVGLINNHKDDKLKTNYRSHEQVIKFNNWFFEELKNYLTEEKQIIYDHQSQEFTSKNEGYVEVTFIEKKLEIPLEKTYLEKTLEKIKSCLEDGFSQKDIALLVRNNKNGLLLSEFLIEKGLNVITTESLLIKDDKEVNFILNLFKFIQNKEDNKAKVEIIKFLYQSDKFGSVLIKNSIKKTNHSKTEIDLLGIIKQITNEFKLSKLYQLSLYDLAETLIRDFGLSNNRTNPFLLSFMELISTYSQKTNDLLQFLEYWEIKSEKASIQTPSNTDAISIMTIHKSKGLQFPVIISTFSNWKLTNGSDMAWIDTKNLIPNLPTTIIKLKKEVEHTPFKKLKIENDNSILLDNFNLLYVALTRAEKRLYIISDKNETAKKVQKASNIALYLNNICRDHVNFDSENFQLIMGEKTQHVSKIENTSEDNILNLDKIISENWRNKIEISQQYKQIWGEEKFTEKIAYGNLIHDLLAQIETEKDIEIAVINFVEKGLIETLEKDIYIQELNTILSLENVKDWFSGNGKSINEKEIISKEGFVFRPDKIVLFQDKTIVIDFKTGNKDSKHLKQINKYGDLLEEMNYPKVEKFLLYTREKEVVAV